MNGSIALLLLAICPVVLCAMQETYGNQFLMILFSLLVEDCYHEAVKVYQ